MFAFHSWLTWKLFDSGSLPCQGTELQKWVWMSQRVTPSSKAGTQQSTYIEWASVKVSVLKVNKDSLLIRCRVPSVSWSVGQAVYWFVGDARLEWEGAFLPQPWCWWMTSSHRPCVLPSAIDFFSFPSSCGLQPQSWAGMLVLTWDMCSIIFAN